MRGAKKRDQANAPDTLGVRFSFGIERGRRL